MQNQTTTRDTTLRRLVHDFDELADVLHHMLDRDRRPARTPTSAEVEFTTEWQMVSTADAEEVPQR